MPKQEPMPIQDIRKTLELSSGSYNYYSLGEMEKALGLADSSPVSRLPFTMRILLENVLRSTARGIASRSDVEAVLGWLDGGSGGDYAIPYMPARVLLQDFTGVPVIADLAAMREAWAGLDRDPREINPVVRTDLVVDHSVQVDRYASETALNMNIEREYERNGERYRFLKWAQNAFTNIRIVPPGTGIVHQVNLEHLSGVVLTGEGEGGATEAFPDTCVGADSHTTMVNGLGVLAWGVGGIEAELVMLGQPTFMIPPAVVGVHLTGALKEGVTATDLVLTLTARLREHGVVGKFVEFYGSGLASMPVTDRATIGNMSPEYGATCAYFPVDERTIEYLKRTGRSDEQAELVEEYARANRLWHTGSRELEYSEKMEFDLSQVETSLAGPRKPQDLVRLKDVPANYRENFGASNGASEVPHGAVAIAAITSCTNTSNPSVMVGAGLLAREAVERGLKRREWVKSSLAPGSKVVTAYLEAAGLNKYLDDLGFHTVGYGCTTCIGNSGPLSDSVSAALEAGTARDVVAVLSGNRNFEGRIHPQVKASYIASPILVVAYSLAGRVDIDFTSEPLGEGADGKPVYLRDIWPSQERIFSTIADAIKPEMFRKQYESVYEGTEQWKSLQGAKEQTYDWGGESTYIKLPPFLDDFTEDEGAGSNVTGARVLVMLGDNVTTDHISPAGSIQPASPAGQYLRSVEVKRADFNSFGARRGNHDVMMRGTFGNVRLNNLLVPEREGDWTVHFPSGEEMRIFEASEMYRSEQTPLIVLAGKNYGSGSSRDWAAKGPLLLGVKAVIAESYERIHQSNLLGMGILPLQYMEGENAASLGLKGDEIFQITGLSNGIEPGQQIKVTAAPSGGGKPIAFNTVARLDNNVEVGYYRGGGMLPTVLRNLLKAKG